MITVRFVLPDGATVAHATRYGPDDLGADRVAPSLCALSIVVPPHPTRFRGAHHQFCDACVLAAAVVAETAKPEYTRFQLPSEGFR